MNLTYQTYPFTPTLGWSISRFEMFDKCKRQYFFNYYAKFAKGIPPYKVAQLKALTSVPLEIGNVVHDIIEAFLRRLQKSDSDIDEKRFIDFAKQKTDHYFATISWDGGQLISLFKPYLAAICSPFSRTIETAGPLI